eukprot:tig00001093_g6900.t1
MAFLALAPLQLNSASSLGISVLKPAVRALPAGARRSAPSRSAVLVAQLERASNDAPRRRFLARTSSVAAAFALSLAKPPAARTEDDAGDAELERPSYVPTGDLAVTDKVFLGIAIDGIVVGRLTIGLFGDAVPGTTQRFKELCRPGSATSYRGTRFYRVVRDYAAQAGDVELDSGQGRGGEADPETLSISHAGRGIVSMVTHGARKTVGSRFFITLASDNGWADGKFTVVGRVLDGLDVLDQINSVRTSPGKNTP